VGCKQAREFLAHKKVDATLRDLIKQPLTAAEIEKLAKRVGGVRELVAPKRRAEAESVPDAKLVEWLAADGGRMRRPIIDLGNRITLGFTADSRKTVEDALGR
jgi:arsenate reductase